MLRSTVLLAALVLVAGCGGSEPSGGAGPSASRSASSKAPTDARVEGALPTASELDGFTIASGCPALDEPCAKGPDGVRRVSVRATAPPTHLGNPQTLTVAIFRYPSTAAARTGLAQARKAISGYTGTYVLRPRPGQKTVGRGAGRITALERDGWRGYTHRSAESFRSGSDTTLPRRVLADAGLVRGRDLVTVLVVTWSDGDGPAARATLRRQLDGVLEGLGGT